MQIINEMKLMDDYIDFKATFHSIKFEIHMSL